MSLQGLQFDAQLEIIALGWHLHQVRLVQYQRVDDGGQAAHSVIMLPAHQKANGSMLGGLCFCLWFWPQVSTLLHKSGLRGTLGISLEKFTKVHHGNQ